ncbi:MAG: helix-turn-helix domain-containing protein [Tepidisphaeraceae bacterium]
MIDDTRDRILQLLDQLSAAQTTAALCVEEIRMIASDGQMTSSATATERPVVDHAALAVRWRGMTCRLGYTVTFRLFERLCRRPNHYVGQEQLLTDVWEGNVRAPETIRSEIRHLKCRLRAAGMPELADSIRGQGRRYGLILDARM